MLLFNFSTMPLVSGDYVLVSSLGIFEASKISVNLMLLKAPPLSATIISIASIVLRIKSINILVSSTLAFLVLFTIDQMVK